MAHFDLSVIIVTYNTHDLTRECLRSLMQDISEIDAEVIVVDNGSVDDTPDMIAKEFPDVKLTPLECNIGYGAANNLAFKEAAGKYLVLLSSDAFLHPGSLKKALHHMEANPETGVAGGRLVGRDGSWQPSALMFPSHLNDFLLMTGLARRFPDSKFFGRAYRTWAPKEQASETDWVPGAFCMIRKTMLEEIGLFDERYFLYYEEVDLCKRVKKSGYSVMYWPDIMITHLGGTTSRRIDGLPVSLIGSKLMLWKLRSALLYYRKHHGKLGAVCIKKLDDWCLQLRAWKYRGQPKGSDSKKMLCLLKRAWKETNGGEVSPPRPW